MASFFAGVLVGAVAGIFLKALVTAASSRDVQKETYPGDDTRWE